MAKVIFGPIVSEARGKQGNLVFSRNAAGAYTRAWVEPDETETPARRVVWDRFAAACAAWTDALSPSQRDAWAAFASRLSRNPGPINGRPVTGRSIFLHTFTNLDNLTLPTLEDPPTPAILGAISELSLSVHSLDEEIILDRVEPTEAPEQGLIIFATPPLPYARNSPAGLLKQIAALPPETEYPINLWTSYIAVYAPPAPGDRIIAQATPVAAATGLAGTPLRASALNIVEEDMLKHATYTLTPDELKHLNATPIEMIAAPGPGKIICPIRAIATMLPGTTPYSNVAGNAFQLVFGGANKGLIATFNSQILTSAAVCTSHPYTVWSGQWADHAVDYENFPVLARNAWLPEWTDGNRACTISIWYTIASF